ncbi:MAG: S1 RNA-binding domain-containing protein, partial [Candidatus Izemoplasmatales bacterium]|nr:S1 RNA-binding domain-containing protein [Candidatus Izemoplasmatales bacterium]
MEQFSEMKEFKVGSIVKGTVLRVTDNEVLVDIGYAFEGSIYKDHLSLNKVNNCRDFCKVGDEIEAKITKISHGDDKNILMLSRLDIEKKDIVNQFRYQLEIDKIVEAKVKKDIDAGLLLDFHGTEMFLPASLIDLQKIDPKTLLNKTVTVKVIDMREERGRMKVVVSRKQAQYDLLKQKEKSDRDERRSKEKAEFETYTVGQVLSGTVTKLLDFGAVVQLGEMVDG